MSDNLIPDPHRAAPGSSAHCGVPFSPWQADAWGQTAAGPRYRIGIRSFDSSLKPRANRRDHHRHPGR